MKASQFKIFEKMKEKLHIKVVCFVIAVFLYIFHQMSILEKKSFVIPLDVIENGSVVNVGEIPSAITVTVRATAEDLSHITSSEMKSYLRLDNIEDKGSYELPVNVIISNRLKEIDPLEIEVRPQTVKVTVDKRAVKYLPLEATIVGQVASGYKIENISISPSTIEVRGPETAVNASDVIYTTKVNVSNASKDFAVEADYLEIDKRLILENKGPYRVTMKVVPIPFKKEYNNIIVKPVNLDENLILESTYMEIDVVLGGDMPVLQNYKLPDNAIYVDLRTIKEAGIYDLPVSVKLPGNISVEDMSSDRVKVTVSSGKVEENIIEDNTTEKNNMEESPRKEELDLNQE